MNFKSLLRRRTWLDFGKVVMVSIRMIMDKFLGKRIVILDLEEVTLWAFLQPVIEQLLLATERVSLYIAYKTDVPVSKQLFLSPLHKFSYKLTPQFLLADMLLSPHIYGAASARTKKVHIPHGQPVKFACLPQKYFERFDVHFLIGPLHREQTEFTIAHYGLKKQIKLYNIGLPKSDAIMRGGYERQTVLEELGLDPDRVTLIYAPSWEEGLSLRAFGKRLFHQLALLEQVNVIIRLHPTSLVQQEHPEFTFYTGGVNWREVVQEYLAPHVCFVPDGSTDRLLAASDMMLTDLSGVALDFLTLLKPVIYLECPDFFEKTLPSIYQNYGSNTKETVLNDPKSNAGRHVGYILNEVETLPQAIAFLLKHPYKVEERKEYAEQLRYHPGHASEEAVRAILELLALA